MDGSAHAAEATAGFNVRGAPASASRSDQAGSRGRQVSHQPPERPPRTATRGRSTTQGSAAAGRAHGGIRSRTALQNPAGAWSPRPVFSPFVRSPSPLPPVPVYVPPPVVPEWPPGLEVAELPWLTPERNEERLRTNRLLGTWEKLGRETSPWGDLRGASDVVSDVEQGIRRADELLAKSRTALLSDAQWRELAFGVRWHKQCEEAKRGSLQMWLGLASESEAAQPEFQRMAQNLRQRLDDAHRHLRDQRWNRGEKCIKVSLPSGRADAGEESGATGGATSIARSGARKDIEVRSRIVPGTALGACFAPGYPPSGHDHARLSAWNHLPGLVHSKLLDARGETLYSGLCHSVVDLRLLDTFTLTDEVDKADGPATLIRLINDLQFSASAPEEAGCIGDETKEEVIDVLYKGICKGGWDAVGAAAQLRCQAVRNMGREAAVAALATDQDKFRNAVAGKTVDLQLCSVASLPYWESRNALFTAEWAQTNVFADLERASPMDLRVRGPDGALCTVRANVKVRQFTFARGETAADVDLIAARLRTEFDRLLGPVEVPELGGDVMTAADAMQARLLELRDEIAGSGKGHDRASSIRSGSGSAPPETGKTRSGLREEAECLERNRHTLVSAGERAKSLARFKTGVVDPAGLAAHWTERETMMSRLMSIAFLMGETPVLCYRDASHLHNHDSEVKLFAAAARNTEVGARVLGVHREWEGLDEEFHRQVAEQYPTPSRHSGRQPERR